METIETDLQPHPLALIFPEMDRVAFEELKKSIKETGFNLSFPIILHEDKILDGIHRYKASKESGVPFFTQHYEGEDPIGFVLSANLARRHLTPSQAAVAAARLIDEYKKVGKVPQGRSSARAAKVFNISPSTVARASRLKKADPEEFAKVERGEKTVDAAHKTSKAKKASAARSSDIYLDALSQIMKVCGTPLSATAIGRLKPKEIIAYSELPPDEMRKIKNLVDAGWTVAMAKGYRPQALTLGHPIRALCERAVQLGGHYTLIPPDGMYGHLEIEVRPKL